MIDLRDRFEKILSTILGHDGGYVDHPATPTPTTEGLTYSELKALTAYYEAARRFSMIASKRREANHVRG